MNRFKALLIAIDQLLNTLLCGWPDETLSARIYRHANQSIPKKRWQVGLMIVNGMFFWQQNHCKSAYNREREHRHLPPELRN